MIKCDHRAREKCPDRYRCESEECAYFVEGSDCDKFNQMVLKHPMTNADRIRAMSDEELSVFMDRCEMSDIDYAKTFCDMCNGQYECDQCRLEWLQQPAKEDA